MSECLAGVWNLWLEPATERAEAISGIEKLCTENVFTGGKNEECLNPKRRPDILGSISESTSERIFESISGNVSKNVSENVSEFVSQSGTIVLPGILQAQGYGDVISEETPWVSGLHDALWYQREEYQYAQEEGCQVPFLAQPPRHYVGRAWYEREIEMAEDSGEEMFLFIEMTKWQSSVWLDGVYKGGDCSLCAPHEIGLGKITAGRHTLTVCIDNRMQYPYRPDGHGVSDALGTTWNGMVGQILLLSEKERQERWNEKQSYAKAHPRHVEVKDGRFFVDGHMEYFRGTHFGGEYPLTGYPTSDPSWWEKLMATVKEWGLNFIRCHSYCPPEAAFVAADKAGVYLQVECGMWNVFQDGIEMLSVLRRETEKILRAFGHHPSFVLFSPTNEPGGDWYAPLKRWVKETRAFDKELGYENRRVYTAQSGWFYDKEPKHVTQDETDYLYFHRSAYGPFLGGNIRNFEGWKGKDYLPSLEGAKLPVICHEMGQWCAYPDFSVEEKFSGYLQPGNYRVFRENAKAHGVLWRNKEFVHCSGKNQVMMYKEDLEANFRTPHMYGFEMLDLHDYLGQGTALVGILDPFWESKGYVTPEEFREFCQETVLLARVPSYVYKNTDCVTIPVEVCHFGRETLKDREIIWELLDGEQVLCGGTWFCGEICVGKNIKIGEIALDFLGIQTHRKLVLSLRMVQRAYGNVDKGVIREGAGIEDTVRKDAIRKDAIRKDAVRKDTEREDAVREDTRNHWDLYVFAKEALRQPQSEKESENKSHSHSRSHSENCVGEFSSVIYTREWSEAKAALKDGKNVVFSPYLSALDYDCPAVTMRPVFWNAQMGPGWQRNVGIAVEKEHPALEGFPTEEYGGWLWEDILEQARGFRTDFMKEGWKPIVTVIDEWNRNFPLALAMEAKVENGNLLLVSACLEGTFEERPAASSLKNVLLSYAASERFCPSVEICADDVEKQLFSVKNVENSGIKYVYHVLGEQLCALESTKLSVMDENALLDSNPNRSVRIEAETYPIVITMYLPKKQCVEGIFYLQDQKDRMHEGGIKNCLVRIRQQENPDVWKTVWSGELKNGFSLQKVMFDAGYETDAVRVVVLSGYGVQQKPSWKGESWGWYPEYQKEKAMVQAAALSVICKGVVAEDDEVFWGRRKRSTTKEIED